MPENLQPYEADLSLTPAQFALLMERALTVEDFLRRVEFMQTMTDMAREHLSPREYYDLWVRVRASTGATAIDDDASTLPTSPAR